MTVTPLNVTAAPLAAGYDVVGVGVGVVTDEVGEVDGFLFAAGFVSLPLLSHTTATMMTAISAMRAGDRRDERHSAAAGLALGAALQLAFQMTARRIAALLVRRHEGEVYESPSRDPLCDPETARHALGRLKKCSSLGSRRR